MASQSESHKGASSSKDKGKQLFIDKGTQLFIAVQGHIYKMGHFWVIFVVLEIVVGHRTFPTKIDISLNNFGFGRTKCPSRNFLETNHP